MQNKTNAESSTGSVDIRYPPVIQTWPEFRFKGVILYSFVLFFAVDEFPNLKIFFVYASDHSAHSNAVKVFQEVVKSFRGFESLGFDNAPSLVASSDTLSSGEQRYGIALEQADVIVIVRSIWAGALLENMEMKTVYTSDVPSDEDCRFISCMHQLKQNSYCNKIVSVSFEHSSKSSPLLDTFPGPVYNLPCDLQPFISYLYSKCEFECPALTSSHNNDTERLVHAFNQCSVYQRKNRNWLAKKLFLLKTYISSDDSGIVTHMRGRKWTKSVRSKSADTVSSGKCRSESQTSSAYDRTYCYNRSRRPRALSCDLSFSFCPPESDREDQSVCYSLLENKFVAINEKYEYILNYKLNSEEDCYTIDGKSV